MTTGCPHSSESFCPTARATTSVTPPAAAVTYMVTGLVGNVCASTAVAANSQPSSTPTTFRIAIIRPRLAPIRGAAGECAAFTGAGKPRLDAAWWRASSRQRGAGRRTALAEPGALEFRRVQHRQHDARDRADDERDSGDEEQHR